MIGILKFAFVNLSCAGEVEAWAGAMAVLSCWTSKEMMALAY